MSVSSAQEAAFSASSGVSFGEFNLLIASVFMSLVFIFSMVIVRASYKAWSKEKIDVGAFYATLFSVILLIVISVYLVN